MPWKGMQAYITGSVDQELLLRNEYLEAENRILKLQVEGLLRHSDPERIRLAEIGKPLDRKALEEVAQIVRRETFLGGHRKLIARKFDGSRQRTSVGRKPTGQELEKPVLQFARENRSWGYRRIVGAINNLGHEISHQAVANVLKRHDLPPAPTREKGTSWKEFIRSHLDTLAAVDFFTAEIWTAGGLTTYYVLVCMKTASRQITVAGITLAPTDDWMKQTARNLTAAGEGFLNGCRYVLHDRDSKFSAAFWDILHSSGIQPLALPPRSPNLNAHLERWNRSVKEECLSKLILFGEPALRHAPTHYVQHYHE